MSEDMPNDIRNILKGINKVEFKEILKKTLDKKNPLKPVEQDFDEDQPFAAGDDHQIDDDKIIQDDTNKKDKCG